MMNSNDKNHQDSTQNIREFLKLMNSNMDMLLSADKKNSKPVSKKTNNIDEMKRQASIKQEQKAKEAEQKRAEQLKKEQEQAAEKIRLQKIYEAEKLKKQQEKELKAKEAQKAREEKKERLQKAIKKVQQSIQEKRNIRANEKAEYKRVRDEEERIKAQRLVEKAEQELKRKRLIKEEKIRAKELLEKQKQKEKLIRQREKLEAIQKKKEEKEVAKQQARLLKVEKARNSQYKKQRKVLNLKVYGYTLAAIAFLAIGGIAIKQSGMIERAKAKLDDQRFEYEEELLMEEAKARSKLSIDEYGNPTYYESPSSTPSSTSSPTPIEEKHETIDTSYYNNPDYEFDDEITASYLKELNPKGSDNLSWITIPGTNVNYPVALPSVEKIDEVDGLAKKIKKSGKSESVYMNEYFLHSNLAGKETTKGTIYMDVNNEGLNNHFDEISDHSVIYGHNMKDGSMFHDIDNYKKDSYLNKHPYGIIYTDDGYGYVIEFIASRIIKGTDGGALHTDNFKNITEKKEYVQNIMNEAKKNNWALNEDYILQDDDKYISLITCNHDSENVRIQLIGKISGKVKVRDSSLTNDENGYYVESTSSTLHR